MSSGPWSPAELVHLFPPVEVNGHRCLGLLPEQLQVLPVGVVSPHVDLGFLKEQLQVLPARVVSPHVNLSLQQEQLVGCYLLRPLWKTV